MIGRWFFGASGGYIVTYGAGFTISASGVASARNGAIALVAASSFPANAMEARITRRPRASAGRNGIGGATITFAIVESSSGAASARVVNAAMVSGVAGRIR